MTLSTEKTVVQLSAENARLRQQLEQAKADYAMAAADAERLRLVLAVEGGGTDPEGFYSGTPGDRVRQLLAAERERDDALREGAKSVVVGFEPVALVKHGCGYVRYESVGSDVVEGSCPHCAVPVGGWRRLYVRASEEATA